MWWQWLGVVSIWALIFYYYIITTTTNTTTYAFLNCQAARLGVASNHVWYAADSSTTNLPLLGIPEDPGKD